MPAIAAASEQATAAFGEGLADLLRPGDTVLLEGALGVGKTTLARAVVRRLLGDPALVVPSPTYAIVQPYQGTAVLCLHIDLYRLEKPAEIEEVGLFDEPLAIRLVEWPERLPALDDAADFRVRLSTGPSESERLIDIEALRDDTRLAGFWHA